MQSSIGKRRPKERDRCHAGLRVHAGTSSQLNRQLKRSAYRNVQRERHREGNRSRLDKAATMPCADAEAKCYAKSQCSMHLKRIGLPAGQNQPYNLVVFSQRWCHKFNTKCRTNAPKKNDEQQKRPGFLCPKDNAPQRQRWKNPGHHRSTLN